MDIKCIHRCVDNHIYVQRHDGLWYCATATNTAHEHEFAEVGHWNEFTWAMYRKDPPCRRGT